MLWWQLQSAEAVYMPNVKVCEPCSKSDALVKAAVSCIVFWGALHSCLLCADYNADGSKRQPEYCGGTCGRWLSPAFVLLAAAGPDHGVCAIVCLSELLA